MSWGFLLCSHRFCNARTARYWPQRPSLSKIPRNDKDKSDRRKKSPEICVGANKIPGQAAGARQQLMVIFVISKKALAFGHMVRKLYRED